MKDLMIEWRKFLQEEMKGHHWGGKRFCLPARNPRPKTQHKKPWCLHQGRTYPVRTSQRWRARGLLERHSRVLEHDRSSRQKVQLWKLYCFWYFPTNGRLYARRDFWRRWQTWLLLDAPLQVSLCSLCRTWAKGGPIKEDNVSYEWQERNDFGDENEFFSKAPTRTKHVIFPALGSCIRYASRLLVYSGVLVIHAFVPFMFEKYVSDRVKIKMKKLMTEWRNFVKVQRWMKRFTSNTPLVWAKNSKRSLEFIGRPKSICCWRLDKSRATSRPPHGR